MTDFHHTQNGIVLKKNKRYNGNIAVTLILDDDTKTLFYTNSIEKLNSKRIGLFEVGNILVFKKTSSKYNWLSDIKAKYSVLSTPKSTSQIKLLFFGLKIIDNLFIADSQNQGLFATSVNMINSIESNSFSNYRTAMLKLIDISGFHDTSEFTLSQKNILFFLEQYQQIVRKILEKNVKFL